MVRYVHPVQRLLFVCLFPESRSLRNSPRLDAAVYGNLPVLRQYSKKRRLLRMEKEYHLVSAISSIYLSNLLIHPQDDTWEPVVQSERMKAITNGVLSAKAMLEKFNTECVAEAYREEFRAFTDLDTAQQRLEGKAYV